MIDSHRVAGKPIPGESIYQEPSPRLSVRSVSFLGCSTRSITIHGFIIRIAVKRAIGISTYPMRTGWPPKVGANMNFRCSFHACALDRPCLRADDAGWGQRLGISVQSRRIDILSATRDRP